MDWTEVNRGLEAHRRVSLWTMSYVQVGKCQASNILTAQAQAYLCSFTPIKNDRSKEEIGNEVYA